MISLFRVSSLLLIACLGAHGRALKDTSLADLQKRKVDCDKISKYTTEVHVVSHFPDEIYFVLYRRRT